MSADINNREFRKQKLKEIIKKLHRGHTVEQVQEEFAATFGHVSAEEISMAEYALMQEGTTAEEIQSLCDVHAAVFKGSIEEIHAPKNLEDIPGHPANTLKKENFALRAVMEEIRRLLKAPEVGNWFKELHANANLLAGIDIHYKVKENLFFSYMEKHGVNAPPKVMWGVDDEIRAELKNALTELNRGQTSALEAVLIRLEDMAFKEEKIMLPILLEKFEEEEWRQIAEDTLEFGFFLIKQPPDYTGVSHLQENDKVEVSVQDENIRLPTGSFNTKELSALLNALLDCQHLVGQIL